MYFAENYNEIKKIIDKMCRKSYYDVKTYRRPDD